MNLLYGRPRPRIVIKKASYTDFEFVLTGFQDMIPSLSRRVLTHVINGGTIKRKTKYTRMNFHFVYDKADGLVLANLSRLFHEQSIGANIGHDQALIYPWDVDNPAIFTEFMIDPEDIEIQYYKLLAHKEFDLKLIGMTPITWAPMQLAPYPIIMRQLWTINASANKMLFGPVCLPSDSYWLDVRSVNQEYITVGLMDRQGFEASGDLNGGIARCLAVDFSLNGVAGFKVGQVTIGTSPTAITFGTVMPTGAPYGDATKYWLDVRSLEGSHIEVISQSASGFVAQCSSGPVTANYLAVAQGEWEYLQSTIRVSEVVVNSTDTPHSFTSALPGSQYWLDVRGLAEEGCDVVSQSASGFVAKTASDFTNSRYLSIHQEQ